MFPFEILPVDASSFWYGFQCGVFATLCMGFLIYIITTRRKL